MGSSAKDVKNRIKSVESTMHITKAMELVASSKLKRAKERMEHGKAYFDLMQSVLSDAASFDGGDSSLFIEGREVKKSCFVIIAGDRGLAGGYNNNIFKLASENMQGKKCVVVPIGKRSLEHYKKRDAEIFSEVYSVIDSLKSKDCAELGKKLSLAFKNNEFDELFIVYTRFDSMLSQSPHVIKVLPMSVEKSKEKRGFVLYEPSAEAVFNAIIPEYTAGLLYGAVSESYASELVARRTAMDSASKNAEEMIEDLSLKYNRARQNAITQEITEIVAGAEG